MAKVSLKIQAELGVSEMRQLNPHLKRKGLSVQKAVEKGLHGRIPRMYIDTAVFLAAIKGCGVKMEGSKRKAA